MITSLFFPERNQAKNPYHRRVIRAIDALLIEVAVLECDVPLVAVSRSLASYTAASFSGSHDLCWTAESLNVVELGGR